MLTIAQLLKEVRYKCITIVALSHSDHNQIFVGIDIKYLCMNTMGIITRILCFWGTNTTQIIPIEMIAVIVCIVIGGLTNPFLTNYALTILYPAMEI